MPMCKYWLKNILFLTGNSKVHFVKRLSSKKNQMTYLHFVGILLQVERHQHLILLGYIATFVKFLERLHQSDTLFIWIHVHLGFIQNFSVQFDLQIFIFQKHSFSDIIPTTSTNDD
mmetsp:Transcript_28814/g.59183  ORF Transcript_28814/g.59183 Transcript_28814/m.59183 type:complete len:116 (+) Transcript_28814:274-621(+)